MLMPPSVTTEYCQSQPSCRPGTHTSIHQLLLHYSCSKIIDSAIEKINLVTVLDSKINFHNVEQQAAFDSIWFPCKVFSSKGKGEAEWEKDEKMVVGVGAF